MPITERDPLPRVPLATVDELRRWLTDNHATSRGIWLVSWRSHTNRPRITYDDLVEECLCFGWIDSTFQTYDDERSGQRLTPRKAGSVWSRINKERLAKLEAQNRILPPGRAVIDAAKADGSFYLLDDAEAMIIPADLRAALAQNVATFQGFTPGRQRQALGWIALAKRDATRADRVARIAAAAARGESLF